jgi:hypothetical protein
MNEAHLRGLVIAEAEKLRLMWSYTPDSRHDIGHRGRPDLLIAGPGGVIFAELKAETGYPDECQKLWLDLLGGQVWQPSDLHSGLIKAELARLAMN